MKQVILVRKDIKMSAAKTAVQVSHASVESVLKSKDKVIKTWREEGMKKVVLKVEDVKQLLDYKQNHYSFLS
mgnify:CR=1 FL=1